jgi:hypothetical protein
MARIWGKEMKIGLLPKLLLACLLVPLLYVLYIARYSLPRLRAGASEARQ